MATDLLGTIYLKTHSVAPDLSLQFEEGEETILTIGCSSLKRLYSHRRNDKPTETKTFHHLICNLFTDRMVLLCAVNCVSAEKSSDQTHTYHALLYPFENGSAILHVCPEISEIDLERIFSTRNENSSPFTAIGNYQNLSPCMQLLGPRDMSPVEGGVHRASPSCKHVNPARVAPKRGSVGIQDMKKRSIPTPVSIASNLTEVTTTTSSRPGSANSNSGGGTARMIRRIGSLNSLFNAKNTKNTKQQCKNGTVNNSINDKLSGLLSDRNKRTEPLSITPSDSLSAKSSLQDSGPTTATTELYSPPIVNVCQRDANGPGTSPTVVLSTNLHRSKSLDSLTSPSPGKNRSRVGTTSPLYVESGTELFYSPASFTHDYVDDGDGSRSILADLTESQHLGTRSSASKHAQSEKSQKVTKRINRKSDVITKEKSLFSMVMESESIKPQSEEKKSVESAEASPIPTNSISDAILMQMDEQLNSGIDAASEHTQETVQAEMPPKNIEPCEKGTIAAYIRSRVYEDKHIRKQKHKKKLQSEMTTALQSCIAYRTCCPIYAAKKLCKAVKKYATMWGPSAYQDTVFIVYKLLGNLLTGDNQLTVSSVFEGKDILAIYFLTLFFVFESISFVIQGSGNSKKEVFAKQSVSEILKEPKRRIFNCIDEICILLMSRKELSMSCDINWLITNSHKSTAESIAPSHMNVKDISLFNDDEELINVTKVICDVLKTRFPKMHKQLRNALDLYDDSVVPDVKRPVVGSVRKQIVSWEDPSTNDAATGSSAGSGSISFSRPMKKQFVTDESSKDPKFAIGDSEVLKH